MGTNYYITADKPCEKCGRGGEELHIGKSSAGWKFLFAPYPERGLTNWRAWKQFLLDTTVGIEAPIRDEYGKEWKLAEFIGLVEIKQMRDGKSGEAATLSARYRTFDPDGYIFSTSADFS